MPLPKDHCSAWGVYNAHVRQMCLKIKSRTSLRQTSKDSYKAQCSLLQKTVLGLEEVDTLNSFISQDSASLVWFKSLWCCLSVPKSQPPTYITPRQSTLGVHIGMLLLLKVHVSSLKTAVHPKSVLNQEDTTLQAKPTDGRFESPETLGTVFWTYNCQSGSLTRSLTSPASHLQY